ncbi:MAG: serine hydrolase domain-containing protein [Pseudomonadales bacterium]|nr:serine hydrolase domain-containing protein [Pseudomonadales bacterium]
MQTSPAWFPIALVLLIATTAEAAMRPDRCPQPPRWDGAPLAAPPMPEALRAPEITESPVSPSTARALARAIRRAQDAQPALASLSVAVVDSTGALWVSALGAEPDTPHYWASVGKIATAVLIEQLIAAGELRRTDTIERYFDVPGASIITIDQLLTHTSGLRSLHEDARSPDPDADRSLEEELAALRRLGLAFCPGTQWAYSNSGYRLLGVVAERVSGSTYAELVADRIADPLGLSSFRALEEGERPDGMAAIRPPDGSEPLVPWIPRGAGSVVATAADMARFLAALMNGALMPRGPVGELFDSLYPMYQSEVFYGRGVMAYDVAGASGVQRWYGHSGGTPGAAAVLALAPEQQSIVAVALTGQGSAEATANALFSALPGAGP